jgi:AAA-like domain
MTLPKFFQAGGTVSPKAPCFIPRSCEAEVLKHILCKPEQRQYLCVLGSRQVGKTSLLFKIRAELRERDIPNAIVDLSPLQRLEPTKWGNALMTQIHKQLKARSPLVYQDNLAGQPYWFQTFLDDLQEVFPSQRREGKAEKDEEAILTGEDVGVIMLDEVATVSDEMKELFFPQVRAIYNNRAFETPAAYFVFIFAGSFHPDTLIKDQPNSPFNVSVKVPVPDFQRCEVEELLAKAAVHLGVSFEEEAIEELWNATRGHPYLTQKICDELVSHAPHTISLDDVEATVDRFVDNVEDTHLLRLKAYLDDNPAYVQLIREIVVMRDSVSVYRVRMAAATQIERIEVLAEGANGYAYVRNGIYDRFLRQYITEHLRG